LNTRSPHAAVEEEMPRMTTFSETGSITKSCTKLLAVIARTDDFAVGRVIGSRGRQGTSEESENDEKRTHGNG
jgi:hypothetical protein